MTVHVQCRDHDIQIPGSLPVTEQCAFNPVCSRQKAELSGCDSSSSVVVRMKRNLDTFPLPHVPTKPLNLICMNVWGGPLNRCREIQNDRLNRCRLPYVHNRLTHLERKPKLCI